MRKRSYSSSRAKGTHLTLPSTAAKKSKPKPKKPKITTSAPSSIPPSSTIFFWKPTEPLYGPFSQWYSCTFTAPLLTFSYHSSPETQPYQICPPTSSSDLTLYTFTSAEHFMMSVWAAHRFEIVKWGNYYKFTQDETLKLLLLGLADRELVEASPRDKIWGIGFGAKSAEAKRDKWGLNLLGKALMEVGSWIRKEEEEKEGKKKGEGTQEGETKEEEKMGEDKKEEKDSKTLDANPTES
ncbi:hypothetical protein BDZ91DRAFT_739250 [Kalaharituber pfeilii]|nr:hypothetical protein BDZ91DRAFT_739250 [Kalaharituber pfeilii]